MISKLDANARMLITFRRHRRSVRRAMLLHALTTRPVGRDRVRCGRFCARSFCWCADVRTLICQRLRHFRVGTSFEWRRRPTKQTFDARRARGTTTVRGFRIMTFCPFALPLDGQYDTDNP